MQTIKSQSLLDSEAINALSVDLAQQIAQVAIQGLLDNTKQSIGAWVNNNCVDGENTSFVYGYELYA